LSTFAKRLNQPETGRMSPKIKYLQITHLASVYGIFESFLRT